MLRALTSEKKALVGCVQAVDAWLARLQVGGPMGQCFRLHVHHQHSWGWPRLPLPFCLLCKPCAAMLPLPLSTSLPLLQPESNHGNTLLFCPLHEFAGGLQCGGLV